MVTVRNQTNEYRMVGGRLLWPGEARKVSPAIAETLPDGVEVVSSKPAKAKTTRRKRTAKK